MSTASIVFTRHELTEEQAAGIPLPAITLKDLASETLTEATVPDTIRRIVASAPEADRLNIYGVLPPVLRAALFRRDWSGGATLIEIFEAHSENRAPEGERPKFAFIKWVLTGIYRID